MLYQVCKLNGSFKLCCNKEPLKCSSWFEYLITVSVQVKQHNMYNYYVMGHVELKKVKQHKINESKVQEIENACTKVCYNFWIGISETDQFLIQL